MPKQPLYPHTAKKKEPLFPHRPGSTLPESLARELRRELRKLPVWKLQEAYDNLKIGEPTGIDILDKHRAEAVDAVKEALWERGKLSSQYEYIEAPFSSAGASELQWEKVLGERIITITVTNIVGAKQYDLEIDFRDSVARISNVMAGRDLPFAGAASGKLRWLATINNTTVGVEVSGIRLLTQIQLEDAFANSIARIEEGSIGKSVPQKETMRQQSQPREAYTPSELADIAEIFYETTARKRATVFAGLRPMYTRWQDLTQSERDQTIEGLRVRIEREGLLGYLERKRAAAGDELTNSIIGQLGAKGYLSLPEEINLLAKTEGNPIRKYCCRECGECAPEELLEEGKFLERISWLRRHYQEKHPGIWGKE